MIMASDFFASVMRFSDGKNCLLKIFWMNIFFCVQQKKSFTFSTILLFRSDAFAFLSSISNKFETQFGSKSATTAIPLAMNSEFAPILASEMKKFNLVEDQNRLMPTVEGDDEELGAGPSSSVSDNSKVQRVRNEVDRVKDIVIASLDSVMERGERKLLFLCVKRKNINIFFLLQINKEILFTFSGLELLVDKTDELGRHSVQFKQRTVTLRRRMWWQNKKMMLIVFLVVIICIYIIVSISCGGLAWPKCV